MTLAHIPIQLPQHIRVADQAVWRAWMDSRNASTIDTKRTYTRQLIGFYEYTEESISQSEEVAIDNYEQHLRERGSAPTTIKHTIRTVRSYWKYAREQKASVS